MEKDVEFEAIEKVSDAVRRAVPALKDSEFQTSAYGKGAVLCVGVAIETRVDPETREAVFAELRRIGCKNIEIECDDADQLVFFVDAPDMG